MRGIYMFNNLLYSQAAEENKKDNYEEALSLHKKAQYLNAGGFIFIIGGGFLFIMVAVIAGVTASNILSSNTPT